MPIFSYLAIPKKGTKDKLCTELADLEYCQIMAADNEDIIVLITDTPDEQAEKRLQEKLKVLPHLQSLSMAFGYDENNDKGEQTDHET